MAGGNDAFTKIMLHLNGTDTSTSFPDDNMGGSAHTWTASGNAQIDTGQSKFNGSSLQLDGSGDFISAPDHADFTLGSGDFTIDFWFNRNLDTGAAALGGQGSGIAGPSAWTTHITAGNLLHFQLSDGSNYTNITGTTTITDATFHHAAFVRTGNTLKMFHQGVQEGGDVSFTGTVKDSSMDFQIGANGDVGIEFTGWIQEFRLSVGIARWTANFTPPTAPYGKDYVLPAVNGAYSLTGVAAALRSTRSMAAAAGAYEYRGFKAGLLNTLFPGRTRLWLPARPPILTKHRQIEPTLED